MKNYFILFFLLVYGFNVESHPLVLTLQDVEKLCDDSKERFYEKDNGIKLNVTQKSALGVFFNVFKRKTVEQFKLTRDSVESHKEHETHETIMRDQLNQTAIKFNIPDNIKKVLEQNLEKIINKIDGGEYEISEFNYLIHNYSKYLWPVVCGISLLFVAYLYKKYVGVTVIYKKG